MTQFVYHNTIVHFLLCTQTNIQIIVVFFEIACHIMIKLIDAFCTLNRCFYAMAFPSVRSTIMTDPMIDVSHSMGLF